MAIHVRRAGRDDAVSVAALHLQHDRELGAGPRVGFLDEFAEAWSADFDRRPTWLALTDDQRPVGVVDCLQVRRLPRVSGERSGWLVVSLVFVSADLRRRGIASRLLVTVRDWATANKITRIELEAAPEIQPLFRRLGYRDAARTLELRLPA